MALIFAQIGLTGSTRAYSSPNLLETEAFIMHHVDSNNLDETNFAPEFYTTYDNDLTTYKEFTENCLVIVFTKPMNIGSILLSFPDSDEDKDEAPSYSVYGVD